MMAFTSLALNAAVKRRSSASSWALSLGPAVAGFAAAGFADSGFAGAGLGAAADGAGALVGAAASAAPAARPVSRATSPVALWAFLMIVLPPTVPRPSWC